jgi:3-oxoacyl-[acyl-carrier-protein] synthase-3
MHQAVITGTGMCVPDRVVTNNDLAKLMDTSDEWITQRTGIRERRFVEDGIKPSDLAMKAIQQALGNAKTQASSIDLIIVATLTPEHMFPGTGFFLQSKLSIPGTPVLDLRSQCSGFIYGLSTANAFIKSGQYKRIVVCGVEVHSRALDFTTRGRDTAVLFGDGAGAVVVEASDDLERGVLATTLHSDGAYADKLWAKYPSTASTPHISAQIIEEGGVYPQMDGKLVFKHAVTRLPEVIMETLGKIHLKPADIDLFLFHQANLRINEKVASDLSIPEGKLFNNIQKYGNCSAASIPMCLHEAYEAGRIKKGSMVCMAAFGSGFTWAASVIRF